MTTPPGQHTPADATHDRPSLTLSRSRLRQLRSTTPRTALPTAAAPTLPPHLWRWLLRALLLVAALAVIEQVLIRPHLRQDDAPSAPPPHGDPIPPLGADARPPQGLAEVTPAFLPRLDDLPPETIAAVQRQLDAATTRHLPVEAVNSIGMTFRLIPPGDCLIGSPNDEPGHSPAETQHLASFLKPFYLAVTEVTQQQWDAVMGPNANPSHFRLPQRPVEEISWTQAREFCRRLAQREGLPDNAYRLPTEKEWEYACRAGANTAFCFGNQTERLTDFADFEGNNYRRTAPVAQRRPNAFGLHDMHGNVWEWCLNLFSPYPGDHTDYGEALAWRTIRGGNWYVPAADCRSAARSRLPDQSVGNMLGFRVLRVIPD